MFLGFKYLLATLCTGAHFRLNYELYSYLNDDEKVEFLEHQVAMLMLEDNALLRFHEKKYGSAGSDGNSGNGEV